jgi:molybdopterin-guanine dinucleotide biosynthesis protein A
MKSEANLTGLVLAGGRGRRMGADKGRLAYAPQAPQARVAWRLLDGLCDAAWVAIRAEQRCESPYDELPVVVDRPGCAGPAAGLLAAWRMGPAQALLVLAVDLPLITADDLELLIDARDEGATATVFEHADGTPEPLCAIWEPRAAAVVRREVENGAASLRRVLEQSRIRRIAPPTPSRLVSVNERSAFERASRVLADRQARETAAQ